MVITRFLSSLLLPLAWTILIQVLLCLPGSSIPHEGVFKLPNLDKFFHVVLFGGFVWFWCHYFYMRNWPADKLKIWFFIIYLIASLNGIIMEYIQRYFIPNRSFDLGDIIADLIAAGLAYGICNIKLLKTKP